MRVEAIWRDSRYLNKEWGGRAVTSYWVRASLDELTQVAPLAADPDDLRSDAALYASGGVVYLLVARDLSSIVCLPEYYPESGQWNGLSPFEAISPLEIARLEDAQTLAL